MPVEVGALDITVVDGFPTISWWAPQGGVHEGYIDAESLTYTVMRDDEVCVSSGLQSLSFVDETISFATTQQVLARYTVWAVNSDVAGEKDTTSYVVVGEPYIAPMILEILLRQILRHSTVLVHIYLTAF